MSKTITVDIDSKSRISVLWRICRLFTTKIKIVDFTVSRSPSGNWHMYIVYVGRYPKDKLRKRLGDDALRFKYDKREKPKQILFNKKGRLKSFVA